MNSTQKLRILNFSIAYPQESSFESTEEEAVHACINPPASAVESGDAIALPHGQFDIASILEKLPENWRPDLISISSSLSLSQNSPVPMGLQKLHCPSVMKLTDSHHMDRPIQRLVEYSKAVGCNYHWTTYNRQHIHFFREAGLTNVFWVPGSINIKPYEIKPVSVQHKKYDVVFLGSRGNSHPLRGSLLDFLEKSGINVTIMRLPFQESLQAYTESKIVFNCSLNGDFNRRVYETLMAQGFLLTDRLAPESGLPLVFSEGQHLECYGSKYELLEKIKYYLAHSDERLDIASQGHERFIGSYHPQIVRQQFYNFFLKGEPLPELYYAKDDLRNSFYYSQAINDQDLSLENRIKLYELLQELHRLNPEIKVLYYGSNNLDLASDLRDLPRAKVTSVNSVIDLTNNAESFDILIIDVPKSELSILLENLIENFNFAFSRYDLLLFVGTIELNQRRNLLLKRQGFSPVRGARWLEGDFLTYKKFKKRKKSSESTNLQLFTDNFGVAFKKALKNQLREIRSRAKYLITGTEKWKD